MNDKKNLPWWKRKIVQSFISRGALYVILCTGSIAVLAPLVWMISTSLKTLNQVYIFPIQWIPQPIMWGNYLLAITRHPFFLYLTNSFILVGGGVVGQLISCSLVAYGFARFRFPGRNILFIILLGTLMIPIYVKIVPLFILFRKLGWLNTFLPIIIPAFVATGQPLYIFLLRQFYMTIPLELDEAAKLDGCSPFRIYFSIILPLSKPALAVVAVLSFMFYWRDFFRPLIYLTKEERWPVALGVLMYKYLTASELGIAQRVVQWHVVMAVSFLMILPCIILFFFAQRVFMQGITSAGIK